MKKLLSILLISFLFINPLLAQDEDLRLGFAITPGVSWLKSDDKDEIATKSKLGFGYGAIADFYFAERYAFSTGLNIMHVGSNYETSSADTLTTPAQLVKKHDTNLRYQYLEIPLTIKARTNQLGFLTYFGQVGFTPAFVLRSRYDRDFVSPVIGTDQADVEAEVANKLVRPLNLALTLSAGAEYQLAPNTTAFAALIFNNGFIGVLEKGENDPLGSGTDRKATLSYVALRVGIFF